MGNLFASTLPGEAGSQPRSMKWLTGEPVILVDRAAMAEAPAADGTRDKLLVAIGPGLDHENSTT